METANREHPARNCAHADQAYPLFKITAAIEADATAEVVAALVDAGFARDRIEVVLAEEATEVIQPIGGSGLRGILTRFHLSLGSDLDAFEHLQRELAFGHTLVLVRVHGVDEKTRAAAVLRQHGGHAMSYHGRWTIATLVGDAH